MNNQIKILETKNFYLKEHSHNHITEKIKRLYTNDRNITYILLQ